MQNLRLFPDSLSSQVKGNRDSRPYRLGYPSHHFSSLDDYLSNIGFGLYQYRAYLILGLILIHNGADVISLSLFLPIIKKEWSLSNSHIGFLASMIFIGYFVGSMLSGKVSDKYGRKKSLLIVSTILYLSVLASVFVYSYFLLVCVRTTIGFLVGLQFPISFTYLAEITPKEVRGKALVIAGGFFTIGEILACGISLIVLDSVSSGNWRALFFWIAQPILLCVVAIIYLVHESPRYEIVVKKNFQEGRRTLEGMFWANKIGLELGEEDEEKLEKWVNSRDFKNEEVGSVSALFIGKMKQVTILLWIIWMVLSLVYYGMVYTLPLALDSMNKRGKASEVTQREDRLKEILNVFLSVLVELPSIIIAYFIIEHKKKLND